MTMGIAMKVNIKMNRKVLTIGADLHRDQS